MTISFIFIILFLFGGLFFYETLKDPSQPRIKQTGLFSWLTSGNWPAKVGAGLLILGVGALLRYALIHLNTPPPLKLGSGFLISAVLAWAAFLLRNRPERRAIRLSLGGAAAGIAYLTAYSAYGFFGYINEIHALALLGLVALVTGLFAVSSGALSVAILAMTGAYVAPAFALETPGPFAVYGYYTAVSSLVLLMVRLRSWRGLIHLSFLFTLAGALFFGWTANLYQPVNYPVMQPFLLAITALHLAMPLVERRQGKSLWSGRFDSGYFLSLPVASSVLTVFIAPRLQMEGALGLALLGLIWALAAIILKTLKREEALPHALVAAVLLIIALICRLEDIPWMLLGLGLSVVLLAAAPYLEIRKTSQDSICGAVLLLGFLNFAASIMDDSLGRIFLNEVFAKRMAIGLLLAIAAWLSHKRQLNSTRMIGWSAAGWTVLMTALELQRLQIDFLPQLAYGLLLCSVVAVALAARRRSLAAALPTVLVAVLAGCGWWAAADAWETASFICLVLTPAALLFLVACLTSTETDDCSPVVFILGLLPLTLLPWTHAIASSTGIETVFFSGTIAVIAVLLCLLAGTLRLPNSKGMNNVVLPTYFWFLSLGILFVTTLHIEKNLWAVLFECLTLVFLIGFLVTRRKVDRDLSMAFGAMAVIAICLVSQAMLLRLLGPDRVLTVWDLRLMNLPAAVSLLWAIFGAGLAWLGGKNQSRPLWSAGGTLLVIAAIKLVLFDFGSLGQLGNILSMIAAGLVFMAVAWLAPLPPKKSSPSDTNPANTAGQFKFDEQGSVPAGSTSFQNSESTTTATPRQPSEIKENPAQKVDALKKFAYFCGILFILFIAWICVWNLYQLHRDKTIERGRGVPVQINIPWEEPAPRFF